MSEEPNAPLPPTDEQVRIIMFQTLEQMYLHSQANTNFLTELQTRLAGVDAGQKAIAGVVDENEARVENERLVEAQKELIDHIFEKSHQYVTVIIAGAFTAYFATLGVLADRFSDDELRVSALLMTISLTVFVMWEVLNMIYIGIHTAKGDFGMIAQQPAWLRRGWFAAMGATLATSVPAIGLSVFVYLRGLGVWDWLGAVLSIP